MAEPAFEIDGVLRRYEWGSRTGIQRLLGVAEDGRPAAELWFGAHVDDPSPAPGGMLDQLISANPLDLLGERTVDAFGERLPFLMKVIAADKALSIQVHPNLEQARAGFGAEQSAGATTRTYTDANHKPELFCALEPSETLCGFRPVSEVLAALDDVPELGFLTEHLQRPDGLRRAFTALLTVDDPHTLSDAVAARATEDGALRPAWIAAHDFPGNIGVAVTVLLNYVRLAPGEAIYLAAGNVHAYLRGMGVEVMANSDNVLRCGLTAKHIDVPELLKITDFSVLSQPRWESQNGSFRVPVPDFALDVLTEDARTCPDRPSIVLCTSGTVEVGGVVLRPGRAAYVRPGESIAVRVDGRAFVARTS